MARIATLISRENKLSQSEKARAKAQKAMVSQLKGGDASDWDTFVSEVNAVNAVLRQTGEGEGKRYSGAADHTFEANVTAFANTVIRGNIATAK